MKIKSYTIGATKAFPAPELKTFRTLIRYYTENANHGGMPISIWVTYVN